MLILSYDVGISVPYPIGEPFCPPTNLTSEAPPAFTIVEEPVKVTYNIQESRGKTAALLEVSAYVDLTDSELLLGSYSGQIKWNSENYQFESFSGGSSIGFENPTVNYTKTLKGKLSLSHAYPKGSEGMVHLFTVKLQGLGQTRSNDLDLSFSNMASAVTFKELTPIITATKELTSTAQKIANTRTSSFSVYPNPFQNAIHITYDLSHKEKVCLNIYDYTGKKVNTLWNNVQNSGTHHLIWGGENEQGTILPNGLYLLQLEGEQDIISRKVILQR